MGDFTIEDMLAIQQALQEKYKDKWEPIGPEAGKHKLLWMLGEVGGKPLCTGGFRRGVHGRRCAVRAAAG